MGILNAIGSSLPKKDAYPKACGMAKYANDLGDDGHLYAKAVRSPFAHARLIKINPEPALVVDGIVAVLTARDIPGQNRVGMTGHKDQRVLAEDRVRFYGEAVALVVGKSEEVCCKAVGLVAAEYEELPAVFSPMEAMASGAPLVGEETNKCFDRQIVKGDVDQARQEADAVIEREYATMAVDHGYIEPEAACATWEGEQLHLFTSSKSAHLEQREVARFLGLPAGCIWVTTASIGGSFGGKPDLPLDCMVALAAYKTKQTVTMAYSREESLQTSTKRHAAIIRYTHMAKRDGTIMGVMLDMIADAGAYVDYSPTVLLRSLIGSVGPYRVPNVSLRVRGILTNNPAAGAMRGFGLPQNTFAIERQMEQLAKALGIDPWELRFKNCLVDGDKNLSGQVMQDAHVGETMVRAKELYDKLAGCQEEPLCTYEKRAWGMANCCYGIGRTALPDPGVAQVRFLPTGLIELAVGSPDIGQGSNTIIRQLAADALGLPPDCIMVISGDTSCTLDSGTTSGTRVTVVVGKAVELAARKFREKVLETAGAFLRSDPGRVAFKASGSGLKLQDPAGREMALEEVPGLREIEVTEKFDPPTTPLDENGQGVPYAAYTYGTQYALVKVDTLTGKVVVEKMIGVFDVGTVVNPKLLRGQMEGAGAMGIGYALTEEVKLSRGVVRNNNFDNYIMPTSLDVPDFCCETLNIPDHIGPFGAKGIGEPAILPVAAAIANAVSNAIGKQVYSLPLTMEKIVRLLGQENTN